MIARHVSVSMVQAVGAKVDSSLVTNLAFIYFFKYPVLLPHSNDLHFQFSNFFLELIYLIDCFTVTMEVTNPL